MRTVQDFENDLAAGLAFEPFVVQAFADRGLHFAVNQGARAQAEHGESDAGIEIKLDRLFRRTGNLFIETFERRIDSGEYASAWRGTGPYDEHEPWLLVIGDTSEFWTFTCSKLREVEGRCVLQKTPTAHGFLLPIATDAGANAIAGIIYRDGEWIVP